MKNFNKKFRNIQAYSYKKRRVGMVYPFKFFKDCLPQILLGSFLNTLSHLIVCFDLENGAPGW